MAAIKTDNTPALTDDGSFEASIAVASDAAKAAMNSAHELSVEAGDALAAVASNIPQLFESVRQEAANAAKAAADYIQREVEMHPKAAVATGAAAAVVVLGMMAFTRRRKPSS